jgi:hypothetical protein
MPKAKLISILLQIRSRTIGRKYGRSSFEDIYPNPNQPRTYFDEKALKNWLNLLKFRNNSANYSKKRRRKIRDYFWKDVTELLKLQVLKVFLLISVW